MSLTSSSAVGLYDFHSAELEFSGTGFGKNRIFKQTKAVAFSTHPAPFAVAFPIPSMTS